MFNPLHRWSASALLATAILSACASPTSSRPPGCACPDQEVEKPAQAGSKPETNTQPALPLFVKSDFNSLPGWASADHATFLKAFSAQCATQGNALAKRKNTPIGLLEACRKSRQNLEGNTLLPAQIWLEANFDVWQFQQEDGSKEGLLTGYFEPLLKGSRTAQGNYRVPLYGIPSDLITVKLAEVYPDLKAKRLRGRLQGDALVPFFTRAEWERIGPDRETPIVWLDDKLDAFLLEVQGSGRVQLPDGKVIRLSYADQNGHPYQSIGKTLVAQGHLTAEQATIPGIRTWAKKNPAQLDGLLNSNPSVVFFKENKVLSAKQGPVGAMGFPLTSQLSLAIDHQKVPYGSPIWIESTHPVTKAPLQQGVLAQDTGGAIRGRIRADYFWGTGVLAGEAAGLTRQSLKMWLIWPKDTPLPQSGS